MKRFAVFVLLWAVVGCSAQGQRQPTSSPPNSSVPASSDIEQRYISALGEIDPGLVVDKQRAVDRGKDVCLDLAQGKDQSTVLKNAQARFDGRDASVDTAKAQRIVDAINSTGLCGG